jgi:hypothetical protein
LILRRHSRLLTNSTAHCGLSNPDSSQGEFPLAGPMFQVPFALQRILNVIVGFVIN